jgi:dipeptidase D
LDNQSVRLASFDGGSLRNAIPREAKATVVISSKDFSNIENQVNQIIEEIKIEFKSIEPALVIEFTESDFDGKVATEKETIKIINSLFSVVNGVYRMSPDIEGLVEASSSLARVTVNQGQYTTQSLQRSSVESSKKDVANMVKAAFESIGCEVVQGGDYPGWSPNADSPILSIMKELYIKRYNEEPKIKACHAGLECGILGKHFPGMDMISFGPNIRAAHSPDEKVQISSVQKYWDYLLETLKQIPLN